MVLVFLYFFLWFFNITYLQREIILYNKKKVAFWCLFLLSTENVPLTTKINIPNVLHFRDKSTTKLWHEKKKFVENHLPLMTSLLLWPTSCSKGGFSLWKYVTFGSSTRHLGSTISVKYVSLNDKSDLIRRRKAPLKYNDVSVFLIGIINNKSLSILRWPCSLKSCSTSVTVQTQQDDKVLI